MAGPTVIPAEAGIQWEGWLDPRLLGDDGMNITFTRQVKSNPSILYDSNRGREAAPTELNQSMVQILDCK